LVFAERMILASDRRSAPLLVGLVAETDGTLDAGALRAAAAEVYARHPELAAPLADRAGARGWAPPAGPHPVLLDEFTAADGEVWPAGSWLLSMPFDLLGPAAIRLMVVRRAGGDALAMVAHHLRLDGRSLLTLFTEVLGAVPSSAATRSAAFAPAASAPAAGGRPRRPVSRPKAPRRWSYALGRAGRRAVSDRLGLRARHVVPTGTAGAVGYGQYALSVPVPVLPAGDGPRPTANDQLLAATHLAVERWNGLHGRRTGALRVRMPTSAPSAGAEAGGTLGNHTSQAVIASSPGDRADPAGLARRVAEQTARVKAQGASAAAGRSGAVAAAVAAVVPGRAQAMILRAAVGGARSVLAPAATVSNVGRPPADLSLGPDGPKVVATYFLGTAGPPQGLMICVARDRAALRITFGYHLAVLDDVGIVAFARVFREAMDDVRSGLLPDQEPAS
jgi:hypothetical protein